MVTSVPSSSRVPARTMTAEGASAEVLKTLLAQAKLATGEFNRREPS